MIIIFNVDRIIRHTNNPLKVIQYNNSKNIPVRMYVCMYE